MSEFLVWLQGEHDAIMACEAQALKELKEGDKDAYAAHMREKATRLAELAPKAGARLGELPGDVAQRVNATLSAYSGSAAMSLRLNSVFFMSALLYKDEHKPDEPDNLQAFINALATEEI